ncbi:MAG TPA: acylphosphatase [Solimonas sp.]
MSSTASYRFHVLGHVQGVFFRQSTRQRALELQIDGWVRNCDDGSVEGLACGEATAIDALREWLQHGPATARVETLTWRASDETPASGFVVRR